MPDFRHWENAESFLGYVVIHAATERGLFAEEDVNLLLELAGDTRRVTGWRSISTEAATPLVAAARRRLADPVDRVRLLMED